MMKKTIIFLFIILSISLICADTNVTDTTIETSGNLTLGQTITFAIGELIDNIIDGWIQITGNLHTTGEVNATNINATNFVLGGEAISSWDYLNGTDRLDSINSSLLSVNTSALSINSTKNIQYLLNGTSMNFANVGVDGYLTFDSKHGNSDFVSNSDAPHIFKSAQGTYNDGDLLIQPRTSALRDVIIATGTTTPTPRLTIKGNGNVGIGTASPAAKLEVQGNGSMGLSLNVTGDLYVNETSGNVGIGTATPASSLQLGGNTETITSGITFNDGDMGIYEAYNTFVLTQGTGSVGITSTSFDGRVGSTNWRLAFAANSATTPIFIPNKADENTGIGWAGAETLSLIGAGSSLMVLNGTTGNVGIGTTSPRYPFEVSGDVGVFDLGSNPIIRIGDDTNNYLELSYNSADDMGKIQSYDAITPDILAINPNGGNVGIGTTSPTHTLNVVGDLNVTGTSYLGNLEISADTISVENILPINKGIILNNSLYINESGKVGIGTTSPDKKFVVYDGNIKVYDPDGPGGLFVYGGPGATGYDAGLYLYADGGGNFADQWEIKSESTNNNLEFSNKNGAGAFEPYLIIEEDGNVGIGTTSPTGKLNINGSDIVFNITNASNNDVFVVNATSGNVGIGTASPGANLDVTNAGGGAYLDIDGSNGYAVLTFKDTGTNRWMIFSNGGNDDLYFREDNTVDRMVLQEGGNVGIGTTSPNAKLEVLGNTNISGQLNVTGTGTNYFAGNLHFGNSNKLIEAGASSFEGTLNLYDAATADYIFNHQHGTLGMFRFQQDGSDVMVINATNGNVGIGTTSPSQKLHISAGSPGSVVANANADLVIEDDLNTGIQFLTPNDKLQYIFFGDPEDADEGQITYSHADDYMSFKVTSEAMRITSNGNVGIGTTSPTHTLNVVGDLNVTGTSYLGNLEISADTISVENILPINKGIILNNSLYINESGNVGIGTSSPTQKLDVAGELRAGSNYKARILHDGSNAVFSASSGGTKITAPDGNIQIIPPLTKGVGIGTTSPVLKLDVNGSMNVSGTMNITGIYLGNDLISSWSSVNSSSTYNATYAAFNTTSNVQGLLNGTALNLEHIDSTSSSSFIELDDDTTTFDGGDNQLIFAGVNDIIFSVDSNHNNAAAFVVGTNTTAPGDADWVELFRVEDTGNFGINTTSPTHTLTVVGDLNVTGTSYLGNLEISVDTIKVENILPINKGIILNNSLYINESGNVGIGIASLTSDAKLQVAGGDIVVDNTESFAGLDSGGTARNLIKLTSSDNLQVGGNNIGDVQIFVGTLGRAVTIQDNTGNVGIGTASPTGLLNINGTGVVFNITNGTATKDPIFVVNANTGRVGIGVGFPTDALHVVGTVNFTQSGNNADSFIFDTPDSAGLTGEKDTFIILNADNGGGSQDESSTFKVLRTGDIDDQSDAETLVELTFNGTADTENDEHFFILGRPQDDEGEVSWGVDLRKSNIWTNGSIFAGAQGTDCAGTNAPCFNSPLINFSVSGGSYINTGGNFGIGTSNPSYPLHVVGNGTGGVSIFADGNVSADDYITRTSVWQDSWGSVWNFIKPNNELIDSKTGVINHSAMSPNVIEHYANVQTGTEVVQTCEDVFDDDLNITNSVCHNSTIPTYENKRYEGISLSDQMAKFNQALYELKQENELLKATLCDMGRAEWC